MVGRADLLVAVKRREKKPRQIEIMVNNASSKTMFLSARQNTYAIGISDPVVDL